MRKTIRIPAPIAIKGSRVQAINYRNKRTQIWEIGIVEHITFSYRWSDDGYWTYDVLLDRLSQNNHLLRLTVTDDQIKLIKKSDKI